MTVMIRMARAGGKKRPFYHIVAADKHSPRDGRFLEKIGTYNPLLPGDIKTRVQWKEDRVHHWLERGAQPSDRVVQFLNVLGLEQDRRAVKESNERRKHSIMRRKEAEAKAKKAEAAKAAKEAAAAEKPAEAPAEADAAKAS